LRLLPGRLRLALGLLGQREVIGTRLARDLDRALPGGVVRVLAHALAAAHRGLQPAGGAVCERQALLRHDIAGGVVRKLRPVADRG
jgi:hypothetical protein